MNKTICRVKFLNSQLETKMYYKCAPNVLHTDLVNIDIILKLMQFLPSSQEVILLDNQKMASAIIKGTYALYVHTYIRIGPRSNSRKYSSNVLKLIYVIYI